MDERMERAIDEYQKALRAKRNERLRARLKTPRSLEELFVRLERGAEEEELRDGRNFA